MAWKLILVTYSRLFSQIKLGGLNVRKIFPELKVFVHEVGTNNP